jgi:hypothetical protein
MAEGTRQLSRSTTAPSQIIHHTVTASKPPFQSEQGQASNLVICYLESPKDCVSLLMAWSGAHPAGYDERGRFHDHIAVPKLVSEESSFGGQRQQGKPEPWRPPGAPHFLEQLERSRNQPWGGFRQPMAGGHVAEDEGSEAPLSEKHHGGNVQERRGHSGKEGEEGRTVGLSGVVDFDEEISRFEAKQRLIQSLQKRKKQPGMGSAVLPKETAKSRGGGSGEIDEGRLAVERDLADLEARIDSHAAATLGDGKAQGRDTIFLSKDGNAGSGGSAREAKKAHAEETVSGARAERRGMERQRDSGEGLEVGGSDNPSTSRVSEARNKEVDARMSEEGGGHELGKEEERGLIGEGAAPPGQGRMLGESVETRLPEQSARGKAPGNERDEGAPESVHPPLEERLAAVRNSPDAGESKGNDLARQPPQSDSVGPSASGAPTKPSQNTGEEGSREDGNALPHQPRKIVSNQVETVSNGQEGPVAEGSVKGIDPASSGESREAREEPNQPGRTTLGGASFGAGPSVPGRRPAVVERTIAGGGRQTERRPVSAVETMAHLERLSQVRSYCRFRRTLSRVNDGRC